MHVEYAFFESLMPGRQQVTSCLKTSCLKTSSLMPGRQQVAITRVFPLPAPALSARTRQPPHDSLAPAGAGCPWEGGDRVPRAGSLDSEQLA